MKQASIIVESLRGSLKKSMAAIFATLNVACIQAQQQVHFNAGADLVLCHIWRSTDFGNSPSLQPELPLSFSYFTLGAWEAIAQTMIQEQMKATYLHTLK